MKLENGILGIYLLTLGIGDGEYKPHTVIGSRDNFMIRELKALLRREWNGLEVGVREKISQIAEVYYRISNSDGTEDITPYMESLNHYWYRCPEGKRREWLRLEDGAPVPEIDAVPQSDFKDILIRVCSWYAVSLVSDSPRILEEIRRTADRVIASLKERQKALGEVLDVLPREKKAKLNSLLGRAWRTKRWDGLMELARKCTVEIKDEFSVKRNGGTEIMSAPEVLIYTLEVHSPYIATKFIEHIPKDENAERNIPLQLKRLMQYGPEERMTITIRRERIIRKENRNNSWMVLAQDLTPGWIIDKSICSMKDKLGINALSSSRGRRGETARADYRPMLKSLRSIVLRYLGISERTREGKLIGDTIETADIEENLKINVGKIKRTLDRREVSRLGYALSLAVDVMRESFEEIPLLRKLSGKYGLFLPIRTSLSPEEILLLSQRHRGFEPIDSDAYMVNLAIVDSPVESVLHNAINMVSFPSIVVIQLERG
ncbi:MAG: hypothetical protein ACUVXI_11710 [bacterium]